MSYTYLEITLIEHISYLYITYLLFHSNCNADNFSFTEILFLDHLKCQIICISSCMLNSATGNSPKYGWNCVFNIAGNASPATGNASRNPKNPEPAEALRSEAINPRLPKLEDFDLLSSSFWENCRLTLDSDSNKRYLAVVTDSMIAPSCSALN